MSPLAQFTWINLCVHLNTKIKNERTNAEVFCLLVPFVTIPVYVHVHVECPKYSAGELLFEFCHPFFLLLFNCAIMCHLLSTGLNDSFVRFLICFGIMVLVTNVAVSFGKCFVQ